MSNTLPIGNLQMRDNNSNSGYDDRADNRYKSCHLFSFSSTIQVIRIVKQLTENSELFAISISLQCI